MQRPTHSPSHGARLNFRLPTLGGQVFWTDRAAQSGWRVQTHALTGHGRVLDQHNYRRGWGDYSTMQQTLRSTAPKTTKRPRHIAVLVHGLGGNSLTFRKMRKMLRAEGYSVLDFKYASILTQIEEQAEALFQFLCSLDAEKVTLITQSMGGLVADRTLGMGTRAGETINIGRISVAGIVRIGTPCDGSTLARRIVSLFGAKRLSRTPLAEVGIGLPPHAASDRIAHLNIAGSLNKGRGINPWISGNDDGLVGISEVIRDDRANTLVVNASHYSLTSNPMAIDAVRSFLSE